MMTSFRIGQVQTEAGQYEDAINTLLRVRAVDPRLSLRRHLPRARATATTQRHRPVVQNLNPMPTLVEKFSVVQSLQGGTP